MCSGNIWLIHNQSTARTRKINDKINIPILSISAQHALVEKICMILFTPTSFKKVKRQILSRATRDLMYEDSRQALATKLNDMFDIPFISDEKEQAAAEALVNTCYETLEKVIPSNVLDMLETSSPEELSSVRQNLISRLNRMINIPFISEVQEEEVIRFIVDFWLSYYGLDEGTKSPDEKMFETEHKLRTVEIELEALMGITEQQIEDLRANRDALRNKLVEMTCTYSLPPTQVENVVILKDANAVGK